jgi:restriction endonuclease S subunit
VNREDDIIERLDTIAELLERIARAIETNHREALKRIERMALGEPEGPVQ